MKLRAVLLLGLFLTVFALSILASTSAQAKQGQIYSLLHYSPHTILTQHHLKHRKK